GLERPYSAASFCRSSLGIFFKPLGKLRDSFSRRRLPISVASSRSCVLMKWRILLLACEDFTKLSQSRLGLCPFCVRISTTSPLTTSCRRETICPFTFPPTHWCPTSVCTAYAKSTDVAPP